MNIQLMKLNGWAQSITTRTKLFALLNLVDYALTVTMVRMGIGYEGNILYSGSLLTAGLCKLGIGCIVIRYLGGKQSIVCWVNVGLSAVVAWNMFWLLYLGLGGKG